MSNVLDLATDLKFTNYSKDELVTLNDFEPSTSKSLPKFKVNWKAPEKPSTALKKANAFLSIRNSSRGPFYKPLEEKPHAIFVSTSRERLSALQMKVKNLL